MEGRMLLFVLIASSSANRNPYHLMRIPVDGMSDLGPPSKNNKCGTDPCIEVTCNRGYCQHGKCRCYPGWTGHDCMSPVDACINVPCRHGYCHVGYCHCEKGWSGKSCNETGAEPLSSSEQCKGKPCKHGGTCIESRGSYRCICPRGKKGKTCDEPVECKQKTCGKNANCYVCDQGLCCVCKPGMTGDPYRKCSMHQAKACASGDPHYTTFDKALFDYQGTCPYVFTELCSNTSDTPYFKIIMTNKRQAGNNRVSYVNEMNITVYDREIHLAHKHRVSVNAERVYLPYYFPDRQNFKFKITNHGHRAVKLQTDFGFAVEYSTSMRACVYVPQITDLAGNLCGLAGNMNGDPEDDLRLPDGTVVFREKETLFGDSWTTSENCLRGAEMKSVKCNGENHQVARTKCQILKDGTGPFAPCKKLDFVNSLFDDCVYDMCMYNNKEEVLCTALESFAQQCQIELPGTVLEWRSADFCPLNCGTHQHYDTCSNACPSTCGDLRAGTNESGCTLPCIEGCTCDYGFVLDGQGNCVHPDDCGCTDTKRNYRPTKSKWVNTNCTAKYSCVNGAMNASPLSCAQNAECGVRDGIRDCQCKPGYEGDGRKQCVCNDPGLCGHGICQNDQPCRNGGTCTEADGSYRCICPRGKAGRHCEKSEQCEPGSCGENANCYVCDKGLCCVCKPGTTGDPYSGCSIRQAKACASGDPHYTTFDNAHFDYQGTCGYVFTKLCSMSNGSDTPYFEVGMVNKRQSGNNRVSYVYEVYVKVYDQEIHLAPKHNISVNSERVYLPYFYPQRQNFKFKIANHGGGAIRLHTDFFLDVEYISSVKACVYLPQIPDLTGNLCGLAGNMNGDPEDDLRLQDGSIVSQDEASRFGDSWIIPSTDKCLLGSDMQSSDCTPTDHEAARIKCQTLKDETGPFAPCIGLDFASSLFDDCVFDMCAYKNKEEVYCTALEAFAQQCQSHVPGIVLQWRSDDFCPAHCGPNQIYDSCADACPTTCADVSGNSDSNCTLPCTEGCTCGYGFILDGQGNCVLPKDCGCTDSETRYHTGNSKWMNKNCTVEYSCSNGTIKSNSISCLSNAECKINNGSRNCYCNLGFAGDGKTNCTDVDECLEPNVCAHGSCANELGTYKCNCDPNYTGQICDEYINHCDKISCKNGFKCENSDHGFKCNCKHGYSGNVCQYQPARHCADLIEYYNIRHTGVHEARLENGTRVPIFCDMETNGGGWTVFQKRDTGLLDFDRNWNDYKLGFGNLKKEFWLGNELLYAIFETDKRTHTLRVDLTYCNGEQVYEEYEDFLVWDEAGGYELWLGSNGVKATGSAGNSLSLEETFLTQKGMKFSTYDRDNDKMSNGSCAERKGGGFWYNACGGANLNGKYYKCGKWEQQEDGIFWLSYKNDHTPATAVQLKFRPKHYDVPT